MAYKPEQEGESLDTSSQAKVILKDPFVGNVSKLIPLPVDHKGPPMRGHLLFNACFEGGGAKSLLGQQSTRNTDLPSYLYIYYVQGI